MIWKNVYIFISSTFSDMDSERDYLMKYVFPQLHQWCADRMLRLIDIDLRWGITAEAATGKNVLDICLKKVDECKPFFLCLLGQRRGWVPQMGDLSEPTLAHWPGIETDIGKRSITEYEVEHAVFHSYSNNSPAEHALFLLREPTYLTQMPPDVRAKFCNDNPEADAALEALRQRVLATGFSTVNYTCQWHAGTGRLTNFTADGGPLSELVLNYFKGCIENDPRFAENCESYASGSLQTEETQQEMFLLSCTENTVARPAIFGEVMAYLQGTDNRPLILDGKPGTGRSTLLAQVIMRLQRDGMPLVYRFVGKSDRTCSVNDLLCGILDELVAKHGLPQGEIPKLPEERYRQFGALLRRVSTAPLVLILDGLDVLSDSRQPLTFIPETLPDSIRLIASCSTPALSLLPQRAECRCLTISPLSAEKEKREMIRAYFDNYLKELDEEQTRAILNNKGSSNPLFLHILLSELRLFGSFEQLLQQISNEYGSNLQTGFDAVLARLERDAKQFSADRNMIPRMFSLLAASEAGIYRDDLCKLLCEDRTEAFAATDEWLTVVFKQISDFFLWRNGRIVLKYRAFVTAIRARYADSATQSHSQLAALYFAQLNSAEDLSERTLHAYRVLPGHCAYAGQLQDFLRFYFDYDILCTCIAAFGIEKVCDDLSLPPVAGQPDTALLCSTLRKQPGTLNDDLVNLPELLLYYLADSRLPEIRSLICQASSVKSDFWIRPETAPTFSHGEKQLLTVPSAVFGICAADDKIGMISDDGSISIRDSQSLYEFRSLRLQGFASDNIVQCGSLMFVRELDARVELGLYDDTVRNIREIDAESMKSDEGTLPDEEMIGYLHSASFRDTEVRCTRIGVVDLQTLLTRTLCCRSEVQNITAGGSLLIIEEQDGITVLDTRRRVSDEGYCYEIAFCGTDAQFGAFAETHGLQVYLNGPQRLYVGGRSYSRKALSEIAVSQIVPEDCTLVPAANRLFAARDNGRLLCVYSDDPYARVRSLLPGSPFFISSSAVFGVIDGRLRKLQLSVDARCLCCTEDRLLIAEDSIAPGNRKVYVYDRADVAQLHINPSSNRGLCENDGMLLTLSCGMLRLTDADGISSPLNEIGFDTKDKCVRFLGVYNNAIITVLEDLKVFSKDTYLALSLSDGRIFHKQLQGSGTHCLIHGSRFYYTCSSRSFMYAQQLGEYGELCGDIRAYSWFPPLTNSLTAAEGFIYAGSDIPDEDGQTLFSLDCEKERAADVLPKFTEKISAVFTPDNSYLYVGTRAGELYRIPLQAPDKDRKPQKIDISNSAAIDGIFKYRDNLIVSTSAAELIVLYLHRRDFPMLDQLPMPTVRYRVKLPYPIYRPVFLENRMYALDRTGKLFISTLYEGCPGEEPTAEDPAPTPVRINRYRAAAACGNSADLFRLGSCALYGTGVKQDTALALKLLEQSAAAHNAQANWLLGMLYKNGTAVEKDPSHAREHFSSALSQHYAPAQYEWGLLCEFKESGTPGFYELQNAAYQYSKAALQGYSPAKYRFGRLLADGYYMPKNEPLAFVLLSEAADAHIAEASEALGDFLLNGIGTDLDLEKALSAYLVAAEQGVVSAMCKAGTLLWHGNGLKAAPALALTQFEKAAAAGSGEAHFRISQMLQDRPDAAKDAMEHCRIAAEQGIPAAELRYAEYLAQTAQDSREVAAMLTHAAIHGNAEAQKRLGDCFAKGFGVIHNDYSAFCWYDTAAKNGSADAKEATRQLLRSRIRKYLDPQSGAFSVRDACIHSYFAEQVDMDLTAEIRSFAPDLLQQISGMEEPARSMNLGACYKYGIDVPKDEAKAETYLAQAAQSGDTLALYQSGIFWRFRKTGDAEENACMAESLLRQAAAQQYELAVIELARLLFFDFKDPDKHREAVELIESLPQLEDAGALYLLGCAYYFGKGKTKSKQTAAEYFRLAGERGESFAQYYLGCYYDALSDQGNALDWFTLAALQDDVDAADCLWDILERSARTCEEFKVALYWREKAAENGKPDAQYELAKDFERGARIPKDLIKAANWYYRAAKNGYRAAYQKLLTLRRYLPDGVDVFSMMKTEADKGNEEARYCLGLCYESGIGTPVDQKMAFSIMQWLVNNTKHKVAAYTLSNFYCKGIGTPVDKEKADQLRVLAIQRIMGNA